VYKTCQNSWLYAPFGRLWCIDKGVSSKCKGRPDNNNQTTKTRNNQTILTGDQRHRNDFTNGQQLSRYVIRHYVYYFFSTAHFLKTILSQPASGTFGFFPTHKANPSQSQKSHFLSSTLLTLL